MRILRLPSQGLPMNRLLAVLLFLCCGLPTQAEESEPVTFQQLLNTDQFRSRVWITPANDIAVGQQIELNIELATSSWFTTGTRIGRLEMEGAIVLKRNKFAVNSTMRERGDTWSVQLWMLTIYPQREGQFTIPPIKLRMSVAGPDGQALEGELNTPELLFTAVIPKAISEESIANWISSPQFEVSEQFDRSLSDFKVGDAVRRTISLQADSVAAMMLPTLAEELDDGLAAYQKPARLEDRVNRGTYRALRRESITYVAEATGNYALPSMDFWWWNTDTLSLQKISLPSHNIVVGEATHSDSSNTLFAWLKKHYALAILALALLPLLLISLRRGWWQLARSRWQQSAIARQRRDYRKILRTFNEGESAKAVYLMQHWFTRADSQKDGAIEADIENWLTQQKQQELLASYQRLIRSTFSISDEQVSKNEFTSLMQALREQRETKLNKHKEQRSMQSDSALVLNPR